MKTKILTICLLLFTSQVFAEEKMQECQPEGTYLNKNHWNNCEAKYYYESGKLKAKAYFKNGKVHGEAKYYYESGKLKETAYFKNGNREGRAITYYVNGNTKAKYYYKNGKVEGDVLTYYDNGNLKRIEYIKNDKREGEQQTYYYESGNLEQKLYFKNDKREGEAIAYYENGNLKAKYYYKNDKVVVVERNSILKLLPIYLGIIGLLTAFFIYRFILSFPAGEGKIVEIADEIHLGAMSFIKKEYSILFIFSLILASWCIYRLRPTKYTSIYYWRIMFFCCRFYRHVHFYES